MSRPRIHGWKLAVGAALALGASGCFLGRVEPARVENTGPFEEEKEWIYYPESGVQGSPRHERHWIHQVGAVIESPPSSVLVDPWFSFEFRGERPWLHEAGQGKRCEPDRGRAPP